MSSSSDSRLIRVSRDREKMFLESQAVEREKLRGIVENEMKKSMNFGGNLNKYFTKQMGDDARVRHHSHLSIYGNNKSY